MKKENPLIECACGCGQKLKLYDEHYRTRSFISGHNGRKYKDPKQHKREWNYRNKEQKQIYKRKRLHKIKSDFILDKGGECSHCKIKYNFKNAAIFDFHHIDPKEKEYNLGQGTVNKIKLSVLKEELKKCILICSNCHRLIHSSEY
ncbi:MAG: hypothetical protein PHY47_00045 [Lachnospiraceae bacterium]|nr:hypothetical protein [Lachnospiraceae bacterium]